MLRKGSGRAFVQQTDWVKKLDIGRNRVLKGTRFSTKTSVMSSGLKYKPTDFPHETSKAERPNLSVAHFGDPSMSLNCSLWSSQPQLYTGLPYTPLRGPIGDTQRSPPAEVGLQELKSPGVLRVSIAQLGPEAIRVWRQAALFLGWRPGGTGEWLTSSVALYSK